MLGSARGVVKTRFLLLCLSFVVLVLLHSPPVAAQIVHVWDMGQFEQAGQLTVYNPDASDAAYGVPVSAGDLNGDGLDDLVISAMAGDGPPSEPARDRAGEIAIVFSSGLIAGQIDLRTNPPNVLTIYGEQTRDIFGIKTHVDDVDGDGAKDLLVGAFYADTASLADAGKLFIISGQLIRTLAAAGTPSLDLAQPWPAGISLATGPQARSRLGVWMATGDVNGDRQTDIIVGADQADGYQADQQVPPQAEAGQIFVLFGPIQPDERIDLASSTRPMSRIYGIDAMDHAGSTVASGDVNGDGFDDIVIGAGALGTLRNVFDQAGGAGDGPNNQRVNAGEMYVVFGKPTLPNFIDLRASPPTDLLTVHGADGNVPSPDRLGEELLTADVNGDGFADLLIGAYRADGPGNTRTDAGDVYIIPGAPNLPGQTLDMASPPTNVTRIYGARAGAITGDSIAAGDINGDGCDDLFVGVPGDAGPLGRGSAGGSAIISGGPALPAIIDLATPSVPVVWLEGPDAGDFSAYWSTSGDFDGDGFIDPVPNGMAGDGPDNSRTTAGEAYIVSGRLLAQWLQPATVAKVVGYWNFTNGLSASLGRDLEFFGGSNGLTASLSQFNTTTAFGIPNMTDGPADVMRSPFTDAAVASQIGYILRHDIAPNGGGTKVNQYTLIMDLLWTATGSDFGAILQIDDLDNATDADLFFQASTGGIGKTCCSPYAGATTMTIGQWHRLAIAADLSATPPLLAKFVDGVKHGESTQGDGIQDGLFSLLPSLLLFADGDDNERRECYLSSLQILDGKLSDEAIASLGAPTAGGIPILQPNTPPTNNIRIQQITRSGNAVTLEWEGAPDIRLLRSTSLRPPRWHAVPGSVGADRITEAITEAAAYYRLVKK